MNNILFFIIFCLIIYILYSIYIQETFSKTDMIPSLSSEFLTSGLPPFEITNEIDKMYYINLDRRQDRNLHFLKLCKKYNFNMNNVIRFKGLDGLTYNFTKKEINMFNNADFINLDNKNKLMGNQLSHYYILKEMIKNNYNYILIFQDDVIFRDDFNKQINYLMKNIPVDAEIINIGFHKESNNAYFKEIDFNNSKESHIPIKKIINDYVGILEDSINPCSLAYLVTLQGAKNLVEYFNKVGFLRATDWNYTTYLINKNINYATTTVLCTGDPKFGSDIFK